MSMGFDKTLFIPLLIAWATYSSSVCPVQATMIGQKILRSYKCCLIFIVDWQPSMIGMLQSIKIKSKVHSLLSLFVQFYITISSAILPLKAIWHLLTQFLSLMACSRIAVAASKLNDQSSTSRICLNFDGSYSISCRYLYKIGFSSFPGFIFGTQSNQNIS